MIAILIATDSGYQVMTSDDYDGDVEKIVRGQQVCRNGATVIMDGVKVATARATDHAGRPLPVWTACRRLRAGTVSISAPLVPASFDGRYFGPVTTNSIVDRAVPLWTWH